MVAQPHKYLPKRSLSVVGCPFSGGQHRSGVDIGPTTLVERGLINEIRTLGWDVEFTGHQAFAHLKPASDPDDGKLKNPRYVSSVTRAVADTVGQVCKAGRFPLIIGGDHSLGIGTIVGVMQKYPDACVIWVDAHADINTPETTASGNIHGCPLSFVTGLANPPTESFAWVPKCLDFSRLAYIGLRDVDFHEKQFILENNIAAFSMHHIDKYGIGKVVDMALARVNPDLSRPIHLSFDVDGMDPSVAPSTGTPVRGGLSWRESMYICEALHETGCLVAMDIMEVNPSLANTPEEAEITISAGLSLARCALGDTLL
ncbi:Arginase [Neolecta irregularis DAH-3]|uniref:Arginase n=1 Tax=Neolecta irregularis (strain DAH-3) TaxID=1198029 RepID=A0A1U7LV01_NEOID|nr:Arginase [Neolecta irregularis DAH-3]|eukprot:OLL26500.1 Arginase [Neolecta irregularis DAH-3]